MNAFFKSGLMLCLGLFFFSFNAQASGGVALGATRVIYPADAKQTSLAVINSNPKERFLINAWVENSEGKKEKSFVITPPLFVSEAKSENTLRIIYAGNPLPTDRESIFWLNVKAIPSMDKNKPDTKNVLQLAILSRIKLFVRPRNLAINPNEALEQLRLERAGNHLKVNNPSPYYITLVNIKVNGKKVDNMMVAPKSFAQQALPTGTGGGSVSYQTVNDYGAITAVRNVTL